MLTEREARELIDSEGAEKVATEPWKHGHRDTYKVLYNGSPHLISVCIHPYEGMQDFDEPIPAKMVTKTVETWEPA